MKDGWLRRFDEPIITPEGKQLVTLRDAIQYLGKTVPKVEHDHPKVLVAADHLTRSAEQGYPMFFARAATLQAIYRNEERVFDPSRKDHHWGKRKLKREQRTLYRDVGARSCAAATSANSSGSDSVNISRLG